LKSQSVKPKRKGRRFDRSFIVVMVSDDMLWVVVVGFFVTVD
jgi:hypothetical protein